MPFSPALFHMRLMPLCLRDGVQIITVIFKGQVLVKCIYSSADLYLTSETEERLTNFRYFEKTFVKMSPNHLLGALAVFLLNGI